MCADLDLDLLTDAMCRFSRWRSVFSFRRVPGVCGPDGDSGGRPGLPLAVAALGDLKDRCALDSPTPGYLSALFFGVEFCCLD